VEKHVRSEDDSLTTRHRLQTVTTGGWKAEAWLLGSTIPVWYPVNVWLRFTPENQTLRQLPKMKVVITLLESKGGKTAWKGTFEPTLEECSKMKKCRETTYDSETRSWGPITSFPPKDWCLQTTITDPFKSDRRVEGTTPREPGQYELLVEAIIDDGPRITFPPMKVRLDNPRAGH
jgi:hypothetical protein